MRNPLRQLRWALAVWRAWRREPGLFTAGDAARQFHRVLLPRRCLAGAATRALARSTQMQPESDSVHRISLPDLGGLAFFWPAAPDPNLWYLVEQETDPRNPHYYTTPPIALRPDSRVLDVGACEGLFAFRCLRQGLAREVIAFEPSERMAPLLRRGAEANGVADRLRIVESAVGALTGTVAFDVTDGEQSGRLTEATAGSHTVPCTSLDDFCAAQHLELGPQDLIKVDAEGADFDVLRGAERILRSRSPQVAVTTYHTDTHAREIVTWLREVQPTYRLRLKGFAFWTPHPRPVLLLASAAAPQP